MWSATSFMATGIISFDQIQHVEMIPLFINAALAPTYTGVVTVMGERIPFSIKIFK
jgi:hypothetical protein